MRRAALYTKCSEKEYYFKWEKADGTEKLNQGDDIKLFFPMKPLRSSVEAAHRILNSRHLKYFRGSLHQENGNFRLFMKIKM